MFREFNNACYLLELKGGSLLFCILLRKRFKIVFNQFE
jgi:hypothetical protein